MNKKKCFLPVIILLSVSVPIVAAGSLDARGARKVLRRFTEARKNLNSYIVKGHVKSTYTYSGFEGVGTSYINFEDRYDGYGHRVKNMYYLWGDINIRHRGIKEEDADYHMNMWDGETAFSFGRIGSDRNKQGISYLKMSDKDNPGKYSKRAPESFKRTCLGRIMGYHRGDDVPIGELFLRSSTKLQLREKRSNLRGVDCYVLEADVPGYGKYTVWIDPVHDYHIARIWCRRGPGDRLGRLIFKDKAIYKDSFEVLEFEKTGGAWFPKTCKEKKNSTRPDHNSRFEREISLSMITLNPDHDALGSFLPDDVPNGSVVRLLSLPPSMEFLWQDGKVVDEDGREVDAGKLIKAESEKVKKRKPRRR